MERETHNAAAAEAAKNEKLSQADQDKMAKKADAAMDASVETDDRAIDGVQREMKFGDNRQLELAFGVPEDAKVVDQEDGVLTIEGTDKDGETSQVLQSESKADMFERASMYFDVVDAAVDLNFAAGVPGTEFAKSRLQDLVSKVFSRETNKVKAVEAIHKTAEKMADLKDDGVELLYAKLLWGDWKANNLDNDELKQALAGLEYEEADIDDFTNDIAEASKGLENDTTPKQRKSAGRKLISFGLEVASQLAGDARKAIESGAKKAYTAGMESLTSLISGAVDMAYGKDMEFDLGDLGMALMSPEPKVDKIAQLETQLQSLEDKYEAAMEKHLAGVDDTMENYIKVQEMDELKEIDAEHAALMGKINESMTPEQKAAKEERMRIKREARIKSREERQQIEDLPDSAIEPLPNATEQAALDKAQQQKEAKEAGIVFQDVPEIAVNEAKFNTSFNESRKLAKELREADPALAAELGAEFLEKMQPGVYLDADDAVKGFEKQNIFKRWFAGKDKKLAYRNAKETVDRIDQLRDQLRVTYGKGGTSPLGVRGTGSDVAQPFGVSMGGSPERMKSFAKVDTSEGEVSPEKFGEMTERLNKLQDFIKEDISLNPQFYGTDAGKNVIAALGLNGNEIMSARADKNKDALSKYQNVLAIAERRRSIIQESAKYTNFHKQFESMKQYIKNQLEEDPGGAFSGELAEANTLLELNGQDFLMADADDNQKNKVANWKRIMKKVAKHRNASGDAPAAEGLNEALAEAEAAKAEADAEAARAQAELDESADLPEPLNAEMPDASVDEAEAGLPDFDAIETGDAKQDAA